MPSGVKCASSVSAATAITGSASTVQPLSNFFTTRRAPDSTSTHNSACRNITMMTGTSGITRRKNGRFAVTPISAASRTRPRASQGPARKASENNSPGSNHARTTRDRD